MIYKSPYSPKEESINTISHGFGLALSIPALILLVIYAITEGNVWHIVSFSIYGSSLVLLYLASTLYHGAKKPELKKKLNVFDHSAIYVLIAGTYTPFALVTLNGFWGWLIFGIIWSLAIIGLVVKLFYTGRFNKISTLAYVLMGWVVIIAIKPLINNLSSEGLFWLFVGGLFYTIGAALYLIKKLPYNHAIFHVFVLLGSLSHFISVFFYVR
ncbi:MAG: hemolysin D [Bacteroidetes bacterium 4572_117]|nr:MAG: hemolysin D [Bacteroidetes bacterium 4572_117]